MVQVDIASRVLREVQQTVVSIVADNAWDLHKSLVFQIPHIDRRVGRIVALIGRNSIDDVGNGELPVGADDSISVLHHDVIVTWRKRLSGQNLEFSDLLFQMLPGDWQRVPLRIGQFESGVKIRNFIQRDPDPKRRDIERQCDGGRSGLRREFCRCHGQNIVCTFASQSAVREEGIKVGVSSAADCNVIRSGSQQPSYPGNCGLGS